jgi:hypothetical protein
MISRTERYIAEVRDKIFKYVNSNMGPGVNHISEITQHLFIGNLNVALNFDLLRSNNISAILCITNVTEYNYEKKSPQILQKYQKRKIEYHEVDFPDDPRVNIFPHFEPTYNIIHSAIVDERKILIQCAGGVSRSATIAAYYLLKRYYFTNFKSTPSKTKALLSDQTYHLVGIITLIKECRPCIRPNPGFIHQLLIVEYQMKKYFEGLIKEEYRDMKDRKRHQKSTNNNSEDLDGADDNEDDKLEDLDDVEDGENPDEDEDDDKDDKDENNGDVHHSMDRYIYDLETENTKSSIHKTKKTAEPDVQERYDSLQDLIDIAPNASKKVNKSIKHSNNKSVKFT